MASNIHHSRPLSEIYTRIRAAAKREYEAEVAKHCLFGEPTQAQRELGYTAMQKVVAVLMEKVDYKNHPEWKINVNETLERQRSQRLTHHPKAVQGNLLDSLE